MILTYVRMNDVHISFRIYIKMYIFNVIYFILSSQYRNDLYDVFQYHWLVFSFHFYFSDFKEFLYIEAGNFCALTLLRLFLAPR